MIYFQIIPKGDWFCVDCKPPELLPRAARQGRKPFQSEDDIEETSGTDGENSGNEENSEDEEDDAPPLLHAAEVEVCDVCRTGGEVICCDGCPQVYHLECLNPPKTRVPRGSW